MFLRARYRIHVGLVVMACLLFQQAAVAAYACHAAPAKATAPTAHCAGMIMAPVATQVSPLCEKHCAPDLSVLTDASALGVPALALPPIFALVIDEPLAQPQPASVPIVRSDPPPRLRYCSLLI